MDYKDLKIWQLAREISIDIHKMTLDLPKYEMYEIGAQIRRSSKSIRSNIVEGFGRRKYKNDFIKFLIYSVASKDESIDHLETLFETNSLRDEDQYKEIHGKLSELGKMLNGFIESVSKHHLT